MASPGQKVLELVVFKLVEGVSREQFLGTVDAVSTWAKEQRSRSSAKRGR